MIMENNIFIGIDPGKDGGLGVIAKDYFYSVTYDKDLYTDILHRESTTGNIYLMIEQVAAICGAKATATFNFGRNYGFVYGLAYANGIKNISFVLPTIGKREFDLIHADKQGSIDKCKSIFKGINLQRTPRCTTDSDGQAEAMLIAEYGKRNLTNVDWQKQIGL